MNVVRITGAYGDDAVKIDLNLDNVKFVKVFEAPDEQTSVVSVVGGKIHMLDGDKISVDATNLAIVETAMGINNQQS